MRRPEYEASLAEARLYPELWRTATGLGLILLLWFGTGALILLGAVGIVASNEGPFAILPWFNGLTAPSTPFHVVVVLVTFIGMFIGCVVAAAALHARGPATLFGDFAEWRRGFLTALAVMVPIYALLLMANFYVDPPVANLPLGKWLAWLPLTLGLLFVQTGAEELFFRGYLQQQLAVRFRSRVIWMWVPSLAFALLHWTPDAGANLPLVLLSTLTFALVAADLTERTGSLGAAMGLHLGNNFAAVALISGSGTITGLALYVSPTDLAETGVQSLAIAGSVLALLLIWTITARLLDR